MTTGVSDILVEAAQSVGARIGRDAIFAGDQCTWPTLQSTSSEGADDLVTSCGPDVYAGTSGIALTFGALYAVTRDRAFARLALGGIRHALASVDASSKLPTLGFYHGRVGVAWSAATIGRLCGADDIVEKARQCLPRALPHSLREQDIDLITGAAGGILALRSLHDQFGFDSAKPLALAAGEMLLREARPDSRGVSWQTVRGQSPNLTGLAHGASGVAIALAELYSWTDDSRYSDMAVSALCFERSHFDGQIGNWRDLRDPRLLGRTAGMTSFARTWCHGAPGIALARMHCARRLKHDLFAQEARVALATTARALRQCQSQPRSDWSLCHGLAGLGDVLLLAEEYGFGNFGPDVTALAWRAVIDVERPGLSWPCGTRSGESVPGALLGLGGIARFLLRAGGVRDHPSLLLCGVAATSR